LAEDGAKPRNVNGKLTKTEGRINGAPGGRGTETKRSCRSNGEEGRRREKRNNDVVEGQTKGGVKKGGGGHER